jgi:hypothetical protein
LMFSAQYIPTQSSISIDELRFSIFPVKNMDGNETEDQRS